MAAILIILFALVLLGVGGLLIRRTSPYSRLGGDEYNRRKRRRLIAEILLVAGTVTLLMAILAAIIPSHP